MHPDAPASGSGKARNPVLRPRDAVLGRRERPSLSWGTGALSLCRGSSPRGKISRPAWERGLPAELRPLRQSERPAGVGRTASDVSRTSDGVRLTWASSVSGRVLCGPQAPWDPLHPEGATSGRFPPPTMTAPPLNPPRAGALRVRCPAPTWSDQSRGSRPNARAGRRPNGGCRPDPAGARFRSGPDGTGGTRLRTSALRFRPERGALTCTR